MRILCISVLLLTSLLKLSNCLDCKSQSKHISTLGLNDSAAKSKFIGEFIFKNETKPTLLLTWAGSNSKVLIAATLEKRLVTSASDVYRSADDGHTFVNITKKLTDDRLLVQQANGLQRNPSDTRRIFVVAHNPDSPSLKSDLYFSLNSGSTWSRTKLNFLLQDNLMFHPSKAEWMMTLSHHKLFLSKDGGANWNLLHSGVFKANWGSEGDNESAIYVAYDKELEKPRSFYRFFPPLTKSRSPVRDLLKTVDFGVKWNKVATKIYSFSNKDKFLFVSTSDGTFSGRKLRVSTDFGEKFRNVHLPAIGPRRFYSIVDMSEGLVFIHVDAGGDGHGTLYTSDSQGVFFSQSLRHHLMPPYGRGSDFYRVQSMKSTYLATKMHEDKSMHSVITHNRGGVWRPLQKPEGAECVKSESGKACFLQVASQYSVSRGVTADVPLSVPGAVGLVIVHGHAASALQSSSPDVFVSRDGGHSWSKALTGPHKVQIVNQGGLIVAVPYTSSPNVVKFSTDEGQCWHSYQFTNETFFFTGLLTEPGNRAMSVAIWGFTQPNKQWRVFSLDFSTVLTRECGKDDYEQWLANGPVNFATDTEGCVLGVKETYMRLKAGSWCANNYNRQVQKDEQLCNCTKEDFECEYGFTRPVDSVECTRDENVPQLNVCDEDNVRKIVSDGYRKLPGNKCVGGFQPNKTRQVALQAGEGSCVQATVASAADAGVKRIESIRHQRQQFVEEKMAESLRKTVRIVVPTALTVIVLLSIVLGIVVTARLRERRRRQLAYHYSAVSAAGRRADANEDRQPNSSLNQQQHPTYRSTASNKGDRQPLIEDTDDAEPII